MRDEKMDGRTDVPSCPVCNRTDDVWESDSDGCWVCYRCVIDEPDPVAASHEDYVVDQLRRITRALEKMAGILPMPTGLGRKSAVKI